VPSVSSSRWTSGVRRSRWRVVSLGKPRPPRTETVLGQALYRAGRIEDADAALSPLVAAGDAPARALAQLSLVRAAQGRGDEAATWMERALARAPDDPWVIYRAAGTASSRGRAIELLNRYLASSATEDPDRVEGARGTIRLYTTLGERKVWVPVKTPDRLQVPLRPLAGTGGGYVVEATLTNRKKDSASARHREHGLFVVEPRGEERWLDPTLRGDRVRRRRLRSCSLHARTTREAFDRRARVCRRLDHDDDRRVRRSGTHPRLCSGSMCFPVIASRWIS
jgi:hypothetical protein